MPAVCLGPADLAVVDCLKCNMKSVATTDAKGNATGSHFECVELFGAFMTAKTLQ